MTNQNTNQGLANLLCEKFLNNSNFDNSKIDRYKLFNRANGQYSRQGGVGIFAKKGLKTIARKDLAVVKESFIECCFIEVVTGKNLRNILIGEIYRVPGTNENFNMENNEIVIGTDQNFYYLKINSHINTSTLLETNLNNNLLPTILRPTRITHHSATQ